MIGDDTGDNISEKNSKYCELTAQYWAWKNLHDTTYIGFCHYRRFFGVDVNSERIPQLLKKYDVISLRERLDHAVYWDILRFISLEEITILLMVIKKKYTEYEQTMIKYLQGNILHPMNMFICKKELFDDYAAWLFGILVECEKHMRKMPYLRANRTLAYIGEFLFPVYMTHHQKKMKCVEYYRDALGTPKNHSFKHLLGNCYIDFVHAVATYIMKKPQVIEDYYVNAVITGFRQDGICL